jgi:L-threonylcarbamoyladenylate synthase
MPNIVEESSGMTQVYQIDPDRPDMDLIETAAAVLRNGGLVAFPTETVYGLAASAFLVDSVSRVYNAKQRPFNQPLPVQVCNRAEVDTLARDIPAEARRLMDAFFPGPLTLVFRRLPTVSVTVTGGQNTIGIRMPDHPIPLNVMRAFGAPLVCPSANLTGRRAPMSAADVLEDLDSRIDMVLDGGPTHDRVPSTVLDVTTRPARLLREGKITREELAEYVEIAM